MHIIVFGAGAIGCYVGGRLALAGQKVTLVGRPRVLDAIRAHGLSVSDLDGFQAHLPAHRVGLSESLGQAGAGSDPLMILLCVKGIGTEAAAREIAACCQDGTPVLSLQNGVDNPQRILAGAPRMQVLAGMVPYNVVQTEPHQVHRATSGELYLQRSQTSEALADSLRQAGLPCRLEDDMRAVQWGKLLLNLNNPVNALSGLPLRRQLMERDYRRVLAGLQDEALAALTTAGIEPAKVGAVPPSLLPHLLRLPSWLFARIAQRMLRIDERARSSMADDLQAGRRTEIDDFCGAVVRLAASQGLEAARNAAMCRLVAQWQPGQALSGPDMRRELGL